jgi:class 3 adenylate cyclase
MEPRIQYVQTEDGVSIAYWSLGQGTPLIVMPNAPFSHVQLEWKIPEYRAWYEGILEERQLVRYDGRGSGLSDREEIEWSLEGYVRDLEAVVNGLGLERFALMAPLWLGPPAVTFAAREPEKVSHLVLWCSWARSSDYWLSSAPRAMRALRDQDWVIYTETVSHLSLGWEAGAPARQFAEMMRECVTSEGAKAFWDAMEGIDVTDLLPQVKTPTLVVHRRDVSFPVVETSKYLASKIPGARLALLDGDSLAPFLGGDDAARQLMDEIKSFLAEGEGTAAAMEPEPGAFRTILFTDVEGSTALTDRLGDSAARALMREHERITREQLKAHGGSEVKTMGDGFMASFSSATKALECAISMQRALVEHNRSVEEPINVRIGLNAGEPIAEDDPGGRGDLFGTAVNVAARIAAKAAGQEILASNVVRELVAGKGFLFNDRGDTELRGYEDPVRVYEVSWRAQ